VEPCTSHSLFIPQSAFAIPNSGGTSHSLFIPQSAFAIPNSGDSAFGTWLALRFTPDVIAAG
jgi:hypothetical protein